MAVGARIRKKISASKFLSWKIPFFGCWKIKIFKKNKMPWRQKYEKIALIFCKMLAILFCEVFWCLSLQKITFRTKTVPFLGVYFWKIKMFKKQICVKNNNKFLEKKKIEKYIWNCFYFRVIERRSLQPKTHHSQLAYFTSKK